jgi:hypothetical protein
MLTIYATHLPLPPELGPRALDQAVAAVVSWLQDRFAITPTPLSGGSHRTDDLVIEWETLFGEAGGLVGFEVDQADSEDPTWRWSTHIDIGVESGQAWLRVRLALFTPQEGLVTRPKVAPHRPPVVRRVVDRIDVRVDGRRVGEPWVLTVEKVPGYVKFLTSRDRRLPVLAIAHDAEGEPFLDRARAADRLLGLAHVVEIDLPSSYAVTDAIGKTLSCYSGAVRMYWPGFAVGDDPYFHRAFVGGSLAYLGREGMGTELFDTLGRLSALSIAEPNLRRRLRREQYLQDTAALHAAPVEPAGLVNVDHDAWAALSADHERQQRRIALLEDELVEARAQAEALRGELDPEGGVRSADLATVLAPDRPLTPTAVQAPAEELTPGSVLDAVRMARQRCPHLVILEEVFASAAVSKYEDPERVLANLLLIEQIGDDWISGELPDGPHEAFVQRCSGYHADLHTAQLPYVAAYRRSFEGQEITLGPHIARGHGTETGVLRIYWWFDAAARRIVVGHVGGHLRHDEETGAGA